MLVKSCKGHRYSIGSHTDEKMATIAVMNHATQSHRKITAYLQLVGRIAEQLTGTSRECTRWAGAHVTCFKTAEKMAKSEKEETEFKVSETLSLCVNNCGVSGNPATENMCQKCFQAAGNPAPPSCSGHEKRSPAAAGPTSEKEKSAASAHGQPRKPVDLLAARHPLNRCSCCRKKVGLTGFRCRCGDMFCSEHRYSDRHVCGYDYKAAGREKIARENPVVKAAKIVRIVEISSSSSSFVELLSRVNEIRCAWHIRRLFHGLSVSKIIYRRSGWRLLRHCLLGVVVPVSRNKAVIFYGHYAVIIIDHSTGVLPAAAPFSNIVLSLVAVATASSLPFGFADEACYH
ncbi:switch-activating protein Sap1 [Asimina triloba]